MKMLPRRAVLGMASRMIHGKACTLKGAAERYQERLEKYAVAETVMKESKLFYEQLLFEEHVTREALEHFNNIKALSEEYPSVTKIMKEMEEDVADKRLASECFDV